MTATLTLTARNATLDDLATLLREQHARKLDVIAPATAIRAEAGRLVITGTEPVISEDGVTTADGVYLPTEICDRGIADKLGIPLPYLRRTREQRPDLWDANINGWLSGYDPAGGRRSAPVADPDPRSFMIRCFRGDDGGEGIARTLLSDRYGIVDHLDVLTAALDGVRQAGVDVDIDGCDLTENRMYVRIVAPQISVYAPDLLRGYRSPWGGQDVGGGWSPERVAAAAQRERAAFEPGSEPVVFAGFIITNSETGGGAFQLTPRLVVKVCANGLAITADALRAIHLGGKQDEGVIRWSADTQHRALQLVTGKARDAVATYLDADYVRKTVAALETDAATPVTDPVKTVETISKKLSFTEAEQNTILEHFLGSGQQRTAGGILQAVTSAAQTVTNPDRAHELETVAVKAMRLAGAA